MKNGIIFLTVVLTLFISCGNVNKEDESNSEDKTEAADTTLKDKIEELNRIFEKAMLDGDYESLFPYYTDDIIVCPDFHPAIKGKRALRESYEEQRKYKVKYHSFSGTSEDIWECSGNVFERGKFGLSVSSKESSKPVAYYGSYFTIWQKEEDGSLKIKYGMWNLDFNPYE